MLTQSITKLVPALLYSTLLLGLFFWKFNPIYTFIIESFKDEKILTLYTYLFIYLFGIHLLTITFVNLLHYLIKNDTFVWIMGITLLTFYALSLQEFYHIIDYFITYPLPRNHIMGMIFFVLLTFGYTLYSMVVLFFKSTMPLFHILTFFSVGIGYIIFLNNHYGLAFDQLLKKIHATSLLIG